jgi:hypothetical protein
MNVYQQNRFPLWLAVVAATCFSTGAVDAPPADPAPRVLRFLGRGASDVLGRADRAQAFRLAGERAKEDEPSVGWYRIDAAGPAQSEAFAREVGRLLRDESSYRFDVARRLGGFKALIGLRLWAGERSVDVVISPATDELVVFSRNASDGSLRTAQADLAPAHEKISGLLKQVLPDEKSAGSSRRGAGRK